MSTPLRVLMVEDDSTDLELVTQELKAVDIPYSHHEKWDGSGDPQALKGDPIPLSARVLAVVEAWDVLAAIRPYREPWSRTKIISYLDSQSEIDFDPQVVKRFLELEKEGVLPVSQDG